jgi:NAD(P)-dependent dehydrogenase (short-subunit alcohol dehydrogenase family)
MTSNPRPLVIVTSAPSGTGYELAKLCAENGYHLLIAADEPEINEASRAFRALVVAVEAVESPASPHSKALTNSRAWPLPV